MDKSLFSSSFPTPVFSTLDMSMPVLDTSIDMPSHHMWSDTQFDIIKKHIQEFEAALDTSMAVGLLLTHFGQSVLMEIREIGYEKSVLMVYRGIVNGQPATLIQHINQISFLLTSVPRESPLEERRPIGFSV